MALARRHWLRARRALNRPSISSCTANDIGMCMQLESLTFAMSGGLTDAKRLARRPLDGRVRLELNTRSSAWTQTRCPLHLCAVLYCLSTISQ